MRTIKLTWFDSVMVGVTFAEAGVEGPVPHEENPVSIKEDTREQVKMFEREQGNSTLTVPGHPLRDSHSEIWL